jgi:hypothetical protein
MARYVSRVLTGARQAATPSRLAKFGREFVEGALAEGANVRRPRLSDRTTHGGWIVCVDVARVLQVQEPAAPDPHTNREKVAHLQAQGITKPQAVAMLANRSELLDSRTP